MKWPVVGECSPLRYYVVIFGEGLKLATNHEILVNDGKNFAAMEIDKRMMLNYRRGIHGLNSMLGITMQKYFGTNDIIATNWFGDN